MSKGKFYVGKIEDFSSTKGYFVGCFIGEKSFPLLCSDEVEVAWKTFSDFDPKKQQRHTHKKALEVSIVISGWIEVEINGKKLKVGKGEFYVIHPHSVCQDLAVGKNTEMIIVKAPSVKGDKHEA